MKSRLLILLILSAFFVSKESRNIKTVDREKPDLLSPVKELVAPERIIEKVVYDINSLDDLRKRPLNSLEGVLGTDIKRNLNKIGRYYGLVDDLLYYQNKKEAHGECVESPNIKGAVGCFQFLEETAKEFGLILDGNDLRNDFYISADGAARYLRWLLVSFYGDKADGHDWEQLRHALAAYNAGHTRVNKDGRIRIPNFYETITYVSDIEALVKREAYWVRKSDTLEKISRRVGVSKYAILASNHSVTSDLDLKYNTVLHLPKAEIGGARMIVKSGMNLFYVSERTGIPVASIIEANSLSSDGFIKANETIILPITQNKIDNI